VRILTILVRFGTEQYPDAEQEIDDIFRRQMPDVERTVVVVDNALPDDFVDGDGRRRVIGGDNSAREFSGFDRALRLIGADIWRFDLVHFATSAFNTLYVRYLERFDRRLLQSIAGRPVCLGHIDAYNEPVEILGFRSQHWVRTGFFMLAPNEVKILGSFVTIHDGARMFTGNAEAPFQQHAPLSRGYRQNILAWLTGGDLGQGVQWHSHFKLAPETVGAFEHKALSIMNEHLLSIRLRAAGCRVVDVTWAATRLPRGKAASIPWDTPWQQQLAGRDHDALLFPPIVTAATVPAPIDGAPGTTSR
jgi:hypothetical protein